MQTEHIAFRIKRQNDEPILVDGEFFTEYTTTGLTYPDLLDGTICATEINQRTVTARGIAVHLDQ